MAARRRPGPAKGKNHARRGAVKDEIHRLECYLVEAPLHFREERLRNRNRVDAPPRRSRQRGPLTRTQAAAIRRRKFGNMVRFFFLLVVLYFLVSWLFFYTQVA